MNTEIHILIISAATIGFVHTALGPDHYIPFIALSKSENWNILKTSMVTLISGLGHVLSSIAIGIVGFAVGTEIFSLEVLESFRGEIAGWLLISFGIVYSLWGIRQVYKNQTHTHIHFHADGTVHSHEHKHNAGHSHLHFNLNKKISLWMIFIIFVLGPCEPLIPLLIYPAANLNIFAVAAVAITFSFVTIVTMQLLVFIGIYGLSLFPLQKIQTHIHWLAGISILLCGVSIQFLGL